MPPDALREAFQSCNDDMARAVVSVARTRNRADFKRLFDHFAPRIKAFLLRRGASETEAEELAQDVLATVWLRAEQYDPGRASVATWIFRITRNRHIDAFRRARRPALDPNDPVLQPCPPEAPDAAILQHESHKRLQAELDRLPEDQLRLLRASFFDGLAHAEIAQQFQLPLGTVKSRIRLAFKKLRERLTDP